MKVKTSVTLSREVLEQIQPFAPNGDRSGFVEQALWQYIAILSREKQNQHDAAIYKQKAVRLNAEAADALCIALDI